MSFKFISFFAKGLPLLTFCVASASSSSQQQLELSKLRVLNSNSHERFAVVDSSQQLTASQYQELQQLIQNHFGDRRINIRFNTVGNSIIVDGVYPCELAQYLTELSNNPVLNSHIVESNSRLHALESSLQSVYSTGDELASTTQRDIEALRDRIDQLTQTNTAQQTQINQLSTDKENLQNQLTAAQNTNTTQQNQINDLSEKLAKQQTQIDKLLAGIAMIRNLQADTNK